MVSSEAMTRRCFSGRIVRLTFKEESSLGGKFPVFQRGYLRQKSVVDDLFKGLMPLDRAEAAVNLMRPTKMVGKKNIFF
jgi:hypothetical protein